MCNTDHVEAEEIWKSYSQRKPDLDNSAKVKLINTWTDCKLMSQKIKWWRRTLVEYKRKRKIWLEIKVLIVGILWKVLNKRDKQVLGYFSSIFGFEHDGIRRATGKLLAYTMGPHPRCNADCNVSRLYDYLSGNEGDKGRLGVKDTSQVRTREAH